MTETTFSFIPRAARSTKPRKTGITEIRGPYYSAYGPRHLADLLETCVIRRKATSDSDVIRPPIPTEVGHPFRLKPATLVSAA